MTVTRAVQGSLAESRGKKEVAGGRPTGRVSKRDWLDKALEVFVSGGVEAVRVVELARQLNVAKSGFYWHFRDRADLLDSMKLYWIDEFSRQFIEEVSRYDGPLRERIVTLIQAIREKESGKLDLAFTSWAQNDASVRVLVDRVRDMRIAFAKSLLAETGADDEDLTTRAKLFVVYFMWSEVMFEPGEHQLAGEDLNSVLNIIVGDC